MLKIWNFFRYLANLEWSEVRKDCVFCDRSKFKSNIIYEDDDLLAINNMRNAGKYHWLIMPKSHGWRDIENLESKDAHIVQSMIKLKNVLLEKNCPSVSPADVHTGFHRGRRVLFGDIFWPDIISIHHLHMHVIVEPRFWLKFFKYPTWLPLMWKSEKQVERELNEPSTNEPRLLYSIKTMVGYDYRGTKID